MISILWSVVWMAVLCLIVYRIILSRRLTHIASANELEMTDKVEADRYADEVRIRAKLKRTKALLMLLMFVGIALFLFILVPWHKLLH